MHPLNLARRHGFTLVELSIVLVVVGLLLGGLLGFRSYANNAALTSAMNESKVFISAFQQFQTRYGAPPGDYPTANSAWTGAGFGDGNGIIRATAASPGNRPEWFYSFQHLALAGFIGGTYTGTTTGGVGTYYAKRNTNVVGSTAINGVAFLFDGPDFTDGTPDGFVSGDAVYFDGTYTNVLQIAGLADNATDIPKLAFLTPKEAMKLDGKFDDGQPALGTIVTPHLTSLPNCTTTPTPLTPWLTAGSAYNTANDEKSCYFILRMQ